MGEYSQGATERFGGSDMFSSITRDIGNMGMSDNHRPRQDDQQRMEFPTTMGAGPLGPMFSSTSRPQGTPSPTKSSPSHNPLLQLLSSVDRPSSLGPLGAGPVGPQSMFSRPGPGPSPYNNSWPSPQQASGGPPHPDQQGAPTPQAYSLFSPSAWPGPLLSSPNISNSPVHSTNSSHSSPQRAAPNGGNMQMFGGGPSPLERLLHQSRNEK